MNAVMERWVQTCRHELLDRTLIWNQRYLLHALREFEQSCNAHRPHQGIGNAWPLRALPSPIPEPDAATLPVPKISSAQVGGAIRFRRGLHELFCSAEVRSLRHDDRLCCSALISQDREHERGAVVLRVTLCPRRRAVPRERVEPRPQQPGGLSRGNLTEISAQPTCQSHCASGIQAALLFQEGGGQ
jgi:hypothetical protein